MVLDDLVREIRDLVNEPANQNRLIVDKNRWYRLCSSLDVLGDTELAVQCYQATRDSALPSGALYLLTYGLFQALQLQQDAVRHLQQALDVPGTPATKHRVLQEIRKVRNDAAGHPIGSTRNGTSFFHFISRPSLTSTGFTLLSLAEESTSEVRYVDTESLIAEQEKEMRAVLSAIAAQLKAG